MKTENEDENDGAQIQQFKQASCRRQKMLSISLSVRPIPEIVFSFHIPFPRAHRSLFTISIDLHK